MVLAIGAICTYIAQEESVSWEAVHFRTEL